MFQLYPMYLLWNRCKTLTGSPDPTYMQSANKPCNLIKRFKRLMLVNKYLPVRFIILTLIAHGPHEEDLTGCNDRLML